MIMRKAVRAIISNNNQLLVMHRNKFGLEYYTLIGGSIEPGETPEQAILREVREEASLEADNPRLVFTEEAGDPYGVQLIYLCDFKGGEIALSPDSDEAKINQLGQNLHNPLWVSIDQFKELPFRSTRLQNRVLQALAEGFPNQPVDITG